MQIKTKCQKCGETVTLDFGTMSRDKAQERIDAMDIMPMECPGYHVELGGWKTLWNMQEALDEAYGREMVMA